MRVPLICIVGRPNVGKSTLFNRLVREEKALVSSEPGTTRDVIYGDVHWDSGWFRLVDTGGITTEESAGLDEAIRQQALGAAAEADLVLLMVDARAGWLALDHEVVALLRRTRVPCVILANKVDEPGDDVVSGEFADAGLPVVAISAAHGRGIDAIEEAMLARIQLAPEPAPPEPLPAIADEANGSLWAGGPIRITFLGRPNAGKSTLANALLGYQRHIEGPKPGTTHDAVETHMEHDGQEFVLVDTAGVRKKSAVQKGLEQASVLRAIRAAGSADVVFLVIDGASELSQDSHLAALVEKSGKGLVLVFNKSDLMTPEQKTTVHRDRDLFPFITYAPKIVVSALHRRGVQALFREALRVQVERYRRIGTGPLNRLLARAVERQLPPMYRGRRPKLLFVSQPYVAPPTFIVKIGAAGSIPTSYQRYIQNTLRQEFGFAGTPLWMKFRSR